MKLLYKPGNEAEAMALKSLLKEHEIAAKIESFHDAAYDGVFQFQKGWGLIKVNEKDFDAATELLDDWKSAKIESG